MKNFNMIILGILVIIGLIVYWNIKNNQAASVPLGYTLQLEEIVNYKEHPVIIFNDIEIKYLESTPWIPGTSERVHLSGADKFLLSSKSGKTYNVNWESGTGELPGPIYLVANSGCYALHINVIEREGGTLENIQDKLVVYRAESNKCDQWAKDLR